MSIKPAMNILARLGAAVLMVSLIGCLAGEAPDVAYYQLLTVEQLDVEAGDAQHAALAVGLGPLVLPDYLKRHQIVTRVAEGQYAFNEYHRWAGLLEQNVSQVLRSNLVSMLGTDRIMLFPWRQYFEPDYRVEIEIIRFDADLSGTADLTVQWSITDRSGKRVLDAGRSHFTRSLERPDVDALIAAESHLLGAFSRQLASAIDRQIGSSHAKES